MLNEKCVVTITPFSGTDTPDKNGKFSVMLQCVAGRLPNRNVISGTVAERAGLEVGHSYLIQVRETGFDKVYGPQFNFLKITELNGVEEAIKAESYLGSPTIIDIERPEGFEDIYKRKSNVVEGVTTKRIKEGEFIPAYPRSVDHNTAEDIIVTQERVNLREDDLR